MSSCNTTQNDKPHFAGCRNYYSAPDIVVMGNQNTIRGEKTIVCGDGNSVGGKDSTVEGDGNSVTGDNCTVKGDKNSVTGDNCTVKGDKNSVTGDNCTVKGDGNHVTGRNCTVEGDNNNHTHNTRGNRCQPSHEPLSGWGFNYTPRAQHNYFSGGTRTFDPTIETFNFTPFSNGRTLSPPIETFNFTPSTPPVQNNKPKIPETKKDTEAKEGTKDEEMCCICIANLKCATIIDCGHYCLCNGCARKLLETTSNTTPTCPVCRKTIKEGIIQIY